MSAIPLDTIAKHLNDFSWIILKYINESDHVTFKKIRIHLDISQEKLYKELARLEGAILIRTEVDIMDKRSAIYKLTDYGEAALNLKINKLV